MVPPFGVGVFKGVIDNGGETAYVFRGSLGCWMVKRGEGCDKSLVCVLQFFENAWR